MFSQQYRNNKLYYHTLGVIMVFFEFLVLIQNKQSEDSNKNRKDCFKM